MRRAFNTVAPTQTQLAGGPRQRGGVAGEKAVGLHSDQVGYGAVHTFNVVFWCGKLIQRLAHGVRHALVWVVAARRGPGGRWW